MKNREAWRNGLTTNSTVAQAYQPIIRGYCGVAAAYYVIMTLTHFWSFGGSDLMLIVALSSVASISAIAFWHVLRQPIRVDKLEIVTSMMNLLVLANVMMALQIEYDQAKLSYFIMVAMIFALASVSLRQALISIIAVLSALFYQLFKGDPALMAIYGFIAFGAAVSAITIAISLRRAIGLAVSAKHDSEIRLKAAQNLGEKMRKRSLTDSLTGLPNRRAFFEAFRRSKKETCLADSAWLVLLDLDGFKAVNDVYGHIIGDALLKAVAKRMAEYCGDDAHVSRVGGDEFNIILPCNMANESVESWCQNLLEEIAEVYQIEDRLIQISGSIGCIQITSDKTETQLVRNADYALMHAKRYGKNRVVVFQEAHAKDAAERFKIEQALRAADFDAEIELLFQPQFDLAQNRIVRAEALARWDSPILGAIGPNRFIKIAEESGLIASITLAVLEKAIVTLNGWENPIPLSINLSGHDLISDLIIEQIVYRVKESGLDPALLEFEVTETAMMADTQKASANLLRLSEIGHPMALDDFGTGYSNFSYLRSLPISKLKVDRSFMENLADPMTEKILHSLVGMAKTLEVHCLLEGIEDELELVMAKRVGAQFGPGVFFRRADERERIERMGRKAQHNARER